MRRPRLVYAVTHPVTADVLLRGQLAFMRERGFDVTVVSSPGPELDRVAAREGVATVPVAMAREPAPGDARSLMEITRALKKLAPDIVHASTPKAGLLGSIAARAIGVPVRIYLNRGLRLETSRGALRSVLATTERVASRCATDVICVSESLRRIVVEGGYAPATKALVLGSGSSNGVDVERFRASAELRREGRARLARLGVAERDPVIVFVGRFAIDKGIMDALQAFALLGIPEAKLVVVGGDFANEIVDPRVRRLVASTPGVIGVGRLDDLSPYYAAADAVVFPSLREGFPNVPLEAASMAVPVVAYRATGTVDAVVEGVTGRVVTQGDVAALAAGVRDYLLHPDVSRRHGEAARARAVSLFRRDQVWDSWLALFDERLARVSASVRREQESRAPRSHREDRG